jgi:hypothetical protein
MVKQDSAVGRRREELLTRLSDFHGEVGNRAAVLETRHAERLECKAGCAACCVDDIQVFEIEAELIRKRHAVLLNMMSPPPEGACVFLDDEDRCLIYMNRPYVCRTQGLPLSWVEDDEDGNRVEYRDICPLNDEGEPIEELPEKDCWVIGPSEGDLAELQKKWGDGAMTRVRLRDLPHRGK